MRVGEMPTLMKYIGWKMKEYKEEIDALTLIRGLREKYAALENKYRELEQEVEKWKRTTASAHELYLRQKARADTLEGRLEFKNTSVEL